MNQLLGNGAAISSCLCWSLSILMYQGLLRQHGASAANLFKSVAALLLFTISSAILFGLDVAPLPTGGNALMLAASGVAGMAIGDFAFFEAMVRIGPKQATLIHATSPVFLLAFSILDPAETLGWMEIVGIVLVIVGVMEVTRRQRFSNDLDRPKKMVSGFVWALVAALSQATGYVLAKEALQETHFVYGANVRLMGASLGMVLGMSFAGRGRAAITHLRDGAFWRAGILPVFLGTYVGIGFMMLAIEHSKTAVGGALLALTPVFIVPISAWRERSRMDWALFGGTVIAVLGVILVSSPRG